MKTSSNLNPNLTRIFYSLIMIALMPSRAIAGAGGVDPSFNVSLNGAVYSVVTMPSGKIWIGGAFTSVGSVSRTGLARLYPDGSLDSTTTNVIFQGTVYALLKQNDGKLLVAGSFASSGLSRPNNLNIMRLNTDGSIDGAFTNSSPSSTIYAMAQQSDGKVIVGGAFTYFGSTTNSRYYVARLNADGTFDSSFNSGSINGSGVNAVAVQADGKILIGGTFSSFPFYNLTRANTARLLSDGTPDLPYFNIKGSGANSTVQSIYLQNDGKSMWSGAFSTLNSSSTQERLGRLNADGTTDGTFTAIPGASGTVYAVTEDTNGNIYAVGQFSSYNGTNRTSIVRVFSDGTLDRSFNNVTNVSEPQIRCFAIQNDGSIIAGGSFTSFAGVNRTNLVRLYGDNYPAEIVTQPLGRNVIIGSNVIFGVDVSNPTTVNYQWRKDGVNIPGATLSQYSIFNAQLTDSGNYSVFVSTGLGSTTSSNAVLQVGLPPVITQQPASLVVTQRQTAIFTGAATGTALNYFWLSNGIIIPGATNTSLTLSNVQLSASGTYVLGVSNFLGTVFSSNVMLTVIVPISITSNPVDVTTHVGGSAVFAVGAAGSQLSYQWYYSNSIISGATNFVLSLTNVQLADSGGYSVVVSSPYGSIISSTANLTVGLAPQTLQTFFINRVFTIRMPGTPGFNYVLQTTTNFQPPIAWQSITTNVTGSNGFWIYHETNVGGTPARFYRVSGQ